MSFQQLLEDINEGDWDVCVAGRVGYEKPGDAESKDFVSVDFGTTVKTVRENQEQQAKAPRPMSAFDV